MNVLDAWLYSVSPNIGIEEEAISITESEYNIYTKVSIFLEHTKVSILLALERYIRAYIWPFRLQP
jgi:hypothetical protein